jgi:hypothetical protein
MGDEARNKAAADSLAATEKEHQELMAALLKKFDVLTALEDRLGRIEITQKQMILHSQGLELLQQRKEGPLGNTRFHKLDFPTFDGTGDPLPILNRCEHYFHRQHTIEEEQAWLAVLHLHGSAQQWYVQLERDEGVLSWRRFSTLLDALRVAPQIQSAR